MPEPPMELYAHEFDRDAITAVRRAVERHSARAGLAEPALYHFVVAVNEIVTNAVRHGGGRGRVRLWREGGRLHCEVTDSGAGLPPERHGPARRPAPDTVGGWGLWLARQGCDALTVDARAAGGSAVTLVRAIDAPGAAVPGACRA